MWQFTVKVEGLLIIFIRVKGESFQFSQHKIIYFSIKNQLDLLTNGDKLTPI